MTAAILATNYCDPTLGESGSDLACAGAPIPPLLRRAVLYPRLAAVLVEKRGSDGTILAPDKVQPGTLVRPDMDSC